MTIYSSSNSIVSQTAKKNGASRNRLGVKPQIPSGGYPIYYHYKEENL